MFRLIRSLWRCVVRFLVRSNFFWETLPWFHRSDFFDRQRYLVVHKRARLRCASLLDRREILAGPFAGMKYAEEAAVGSSLWPKLLGTYESELRPCFDEIVRHPNYQKIVDVGYAEGFYLVGLGRLFTNADLVGFDNEPEARRLCHANAKINGIDEQRLHLHGTFDPEMFRQTLNEDALVVVDCEGVENEVIGSLSEDELKRADWLIETHDHLVDGTTERLKAAFAKTHDLAEVATDNDLQSKCRLLPESIQQSCDSYVQEALVSEGRLASQSWIFATRRAA